MNTKIGNLIKSLDGAIESGEVQVEDSEARFHLLRPFEQLLAPLPIFPTIPLHGRTPKIAWLLWLKTHPVQVDPESILAETSHKDGFVRAAALDTLTVMLDPLRVPQTTPGMYDRICVALRKQRSREILPGLAFQIDELLNQAAKLARSRRPTSMPLSPNPYVAGPPLRAKEKFFGRQDLLEEIGETFGEDTGFKSIVVYGARRTGKTSLLYRIRDGALGEHFVCVYLDMQGVAGTPIETFLGGIVSGITSRLAEQTTVVVLPPPSGDVDFPFLQEFLNAALAVVAPRRLVLLLDEYEVLKSYIQDADVARQFQFLLEHEPKFFMVFAGAQKVEVLRETNFLLLLDSCKYMKIGLLRPEQARSLITEPTRGLLYFGDDIIGTIQELCAGHPFYTQSLCQSIFELVEGGGAVTTQHVDLAVQQFLENPAPHLILGWNALPLDQKITASTLASLQEEPGTWVSPQAISADLPRRNYPISFGLAEIQQALSQLREADWIEKKASEFLFRFSLGLVRRWIAEHRSIWTLLEEHRQSLRGRMVGLGRRLVAFSIDVGIMFVVLILYLLCVTLLERNGNSSAILLAAGVPILPVAYFTVSMAAARATPGMYIVRVRAISDAGGPLRRLRGGFFGVLLAFPLSLVLVWSSLKARGLEWMSLAVGVLLAVLHCTTIYFSKRRRGLFDRIAQVLVVRE